MITPMVIRNPLAPDEIDYLLGLMMEAEEPKDIDGVEPVSYTHLTLPTTPYV